LECIVPGFISFFAEPDSSRAQNNVDAVVLLLDFESQHVAVKRDAAAGVGNRQESHHRTRDLPGVLSVNLRLQCAPAFEAVFACDTKKSDCKLRIRIGPAQFLQSLFGSFLEIFERGTLRKLRISHRHLASKFARCPRISGWKSGSLKIRLSGRRVEPFTRTVGRVIGLPKIIHRESHSPNTSL
jgi:hypothetical protein